jgi:uncharacterized protein
MPHSLPSTLASHSYISLTTFRKNGAAIPTPVWFAMEGDKMYVMTRSDSGKAKRIRNNPEVRIAPSTIRGKVTGPEVAARARFLPRESWEHARQLIRAKYWLARIPFLWSKENIYLEIAAD